MLEMNFIFPTVIEVWTLLWTQWIAYKVNVTPRCTWPTASIIRWMSEKKWNFCLQNECDVMAAVISKFQTHMWHSPKLWVLRCKNPKFRYLHFRSHGSFRKIIREANMMYHRNNISDVHSFYFNPKTLFTVLIARHILLHVICWWRRTSTRPKITENVTYVHILWIKYLELFHAYHIHFHFALLFL